MENAVGGGGGAGGSNVPAFLTKLWTLVEDPETDPLICWSPTLSPLSRLATIPASRISATVFCCSLDATLGFCDARGFQT
ncbi:UNVERIFIED_CONTAM: hypothetical protein K2H54_001925 [Gekko kuhli]